MPQTPGALAEEPGKFLPNLRPTLAWNQVPGATHYGVFISKKPYIGYLIHEAYYVRETSYLLPSGVLKSGNKYRWNVVAYKDSTLGEYSDKLYFRTQ